jgi:serine/threonine protein kinase
LLCDRDTFHDLQQPPNAPAVHAPEFESVFVENLIKSSGQLEVKVALEIATQVAAGLTAVHKQKLVHRKGLLYLLKRFYMLPKSILYDVHCMM